VVVRFVLSDVNTTRAGASGMVSGVAVFDLDRGVVDLKSVMEVVADAAEQGVAFDFVRDDEMHGKGRVGGAHRPDVEVVHLADSGDSAR
jgi:hypothetical protein